MRKSKILVLAPLLFFALPACADKQDQDKVAVDNPKGAYLKVKGVDENDTLNLRTEADGKSALVFKLPHNASGILKLASSGKWVRVSYSGHQGWAYGKYLQESAAVNIGSTFGKALFCLGTEPHWTLKEENGYLKFEHFDQLTSYVPDSEIRTSRNETGIYSMSAISPDDINKHLSALFKKDDQCSDGMSDNKYRYSAVIDGGGVELFSGCCK